MCNGLIVCYELLLNVCVYFIQISSNPDKKKDLSDFYSGFKGNDRKTEMAAYANIH